MLDLETLGTSAGSVVWAIGAVAATKLGDGRWEIGENSAFYALISVEDVGNHGLQIDPSTLAWWMKQSPEARAELQKALEGGDGVLSLPEALDQFLFWLCERTVDSRTFGMIGELRLWGNGADFDPVLLGACYDATKTPRPWGPKSARCYRTLKELYPEITLERGVGVHHRADHDALAQMRHLVALLEHVDSARRGASDDPFQAVSFRPPPAVPVSQPPNPDSIP